MRTGGGEARGGLPRAFDEEGWRLRAGSADPALVYAPHRGPGGRFFNPWLEDDRRPWHLLRWLASRGSFDPGTAPPVPVVPNDGAYLARPHEPPSLTHVGHATYALHWEGQVLVTDPFFGRRAAVVRRSAPPAFGPGAFPPGTVVVITHNHYDHLDRRSVAALAERAAFLCPLGLGGLLRAWGVREVRELDWWEEAEVGGTVLTCLPAQHWSRRLGQGRNRTLWCSWLAARGGLRAFLGGDSGYFVGFREIGRRFPGIDLALVPAGAYAPRWFMHYHHMNVPEALQAFRDLGARAMVPVHWGALRLGDEPPTRPLEDLRRELEQRPGLADRVRVLPVGGRLLLGGPAGRSRSGPPPAPRRESTLRASTPPTPGQPGRDPASG